MHAVSPGRRSLRIVIRPLRYEHMFGDERRQPLRALSPGARRPATRRSSSPPRASCRRCALDDALRICLVLRGGDPDRYERAAVRWLGRFALEAREASRSTTSGWRPARSTPCPSTRPRRWSCCSGCAWRAGSRTARVAWPRAPGGLRPPGVPAHSARGVPHAAAPRERDLHNLPLPAAASRGMSFTSQMQSVPRSTGRANGVRMALARTADATPRHRGPVASAACSPNGPPARSRSSPPPATPPHAIPVSAAVRAGPRRALIALAAGRGSLARLRADPRVSLTIVCEDVAVTALRARARARRRRSCRGRRRGRDRGRARPGPQPADVRDRVRSAVALDRSRGRAARRRGARGAGAARRSRPAKSGRARQRDRV